MSRITWLETGTKKYETGVKQGVLYPQVGGVYPVGVPWVGLTAVNENPTGAEANPLYADDVKYLNLISAEEYGYTIEAYTYPDEFAECDGSVAVVEGVMIGQQTRTPFGICYRTTIGNDSEGDNYGYKLHMVYGGIATPSEKAYNTKNDNPDAITFSWEVNTTPVAVPGHKPTSSIVIDSTKFKGERAALLAALEDVLYGTEEKDARLPLPEEVIQILSGN